MVAHRTRGFLDTCSRIDRPCWQVYPTVGNPPAPRGKTLRAEWNEQADGICQLSERITRLALYPDMLTSPDIGLPCYDLRTSTVPIASRSNRGCDGQLHQLPRQPPKNTPLSCLRPELATNGIVSAELAKLRAPAPDLSSRSIYSDSSAT